MNRQTSRFLLIVVVLGITCTCSSAENAQKNIFAETLAQTNSMLFVSRNQYTKRHGTEATMYQTGEINTRYFRGGSVLKVVDVTTKKVTTILNAPKDIIRDPEVHFDENKILFSIHKKIKDNYHLYEIDYSVRLLHTAYPPAQQHHSLPFNPQPEIHPLTTDWKVNEGARLSGQFYAHEAQPVFHRL